jgi:hypothetical protein
VVNANPLLVKEMASPLAKKLEEEKKTVEELGEFSFTFILPYKNY